MKTLQQTETANQLWGIYHTDREYAREFGDPLRTVVQAATKEEAEREAARLGFDGAWAHPVKPEDLSQAEWLPINLRHRTRLRRLAKGVRV